MRSATAVIMLGVFESYDGGGRLGFKHNETRGARRHYMKKVPQQVADAMKQLGKKSPVQHCGLPN
jgi:hypothetical protein